jgi:uncharacterized small protein (DUF1192 family)
MVDRTSTSTAPWTLVESNDKNYARIKILRTVCERLEAELDGKVVAASATNAANRKKGKSRK